MCKKSSKFAPKIDIIMRNRVFICLMALVMVVLTACQSNDPSMRKDTFDLPAYADGWVFAQDLNQYYYHFEMPELTNAIYNYGEFSIHHEYNPGTESRYQVALPETIYQGDYIEHLDYTIGPGYVQIYYTRSDHAYPENFTPGDMLFRLQMTY